MIWLTVLIVCALLGAAYGGHVFIYRINHRAPLPAASTEPSVVRERLWHVTLQARTSAGWKVIRRGSVPYAARNGDEVAAEAERLAREAFGAGIQYHAVATPAS